MRSDLIRTRPGLTAVQLQGVVDYIRDGLANNLLIADVAAIVGMSTTHFKSMFKRSVGIPVHQYIIKLRVERAIALLSSGRPRLIDVAQLSGFSDQSHMSRCMRRTVGRTPTQIARRENPG